MRVGYEMHMERANEVHSVELSITISYQTNTNGIEFFLLKTLSIYREFFPTLIVETTDFKLFLISEQTRTVTIFEKHGIMAHIP